MLFHIIIIILHLCIFCNSIFSIKNTWILYFFNENIIIVIIKMTKNNEINEICTIVRSILIARSNEGSTINEILG